MPFFPDLSAYNYFVRRPLSRVLAVGWLDSFHDFATGRVPSQILDKLRAMMLGNELVNIHVNPMRGIHPCNFCGAEEQFLRSKFREGWSEIWIPYGGGFFAAPSMILHYIEEHRYFPPKEFLEAIERFDLTQPFRAQLEYDKIIDQLAGKE